MKQFAGGDDARKELDLKLDRLLAETIDGWDDCGSAQCRRERRCASDGLECIAKWRESLPPLSPEEAEARMEDFRIALEARKRLGGESVTAEQLEEAIRNEKAARLAAMPPQKGDATTPIAEETKLAPEQQALIDRAWNDYVKEQDRAREPGPRITQL